MAETLIIDGVKVTLIGLTDVTADEPKNYVDYVKQHIKQHVVERLKSITVVACSDGKVDVNYELQGPKFERIRRITGYLTGTLDSWNNSKRAEERDRVKHYIDVEE